MSSNPKDSVAYLLGQLDTKMDSLLASNALVVAQQATLDNRVSSLEGTRTKVYVVASFLSVTFGAVVSFFGSIYQWMNQKSL